MCEFDWVKWKLILKNKKEGWRTAEESTKVAVGKSQKTCSNHGVWRSRTGCFVVSQEKLLGCVLEKWFQFTEVLFNYLLFLDNPAYA